MARTRLLFPIALLLTLHLIVLAGNISLNEAVQKGWVRCNFTSALKDSSSLLRSSYYGPCLNLHLESLSNKPLNLLLENGRLLETTDTSEQRMIITQEELISLQPGKTKQFRVFAMCTQMHDRSPGKESLLAMGNMADGNLLQISRFIGKNHYQGLAGQEAVWVITDHNDLGSIYSENKDELRNLQQFVSTLTGRPIPPTPHRIEYAEGIVSGEIAFENPGKQSYSLKMVDESGAVIGTFFENRIIEKPMTTILTWRFRFKGFPKGVYYVKLTDGSQVLVASRPVVIN